MNVYTQDPRYQQPLRISINGDRTALTPTPNDRWIPQKEEQSNDGAGDKRLRFFLFPALMLPLNYDRSVTLPITRNGDMKGSVPSQRVNGQKAKRKGRGWRDGEMFKVECVYTYADRGGDYNTMRGIKVASSLKC